MTDRKKLSDILSNGNGDNFRNNWNATAAADDFGPLPPGEYICRILSGDLFQAKRNSTPGYKLSMQVTVGEYTGRRCWNDFWLTPLALPLSKRDLAKIGIDDPAKMEKPLPPGILVKLKLALRKDDDGNETNKVQRFEFFDVEPPDAFAPPPDGSKPADSDEPTATDGGTNR